MSRKLSKRKFSWLKDNKLKSEDGQDKDFLVTPSIIFAHSSFSKPDLKELGVCWGFAVSWGFWSFGFGAFRAYLD